MSLMTGATRIAENWLRLVFVVVISFAWCVLPANIETDLTPTTTIITKRGATAAAAAALPCATCVFEAGVKGQQCGYKIY